MTMPYVFLNNFFVESGKACVPVQDRGFLFGEGVFTTIRVFNGHPEFLNEHFSRLKTSCRELEIPYQVIPVETIDELIKLNEAQSGLWRLKIIITGSNHLLITLEKEMQNIKKDSLQLIQYPNPFESPLAQIKTLSYLDRLQVSRFAKQNNRDDAVVLSQQGFLCETAFANLFWIENNEFYTPDPALPLLKGVLLTKVEECVKKMGYKVHRVQMTMKDISSNSHVFVCNAIKHVCPVSSIDGRRFKLVPSLSAEIDKRVSELSKEQAE